MTSTTSVTVTTRAQMLRGVGAPGYRGFGNAPRTSLKLPWAVKGSLRGQARTIEEDEFQKLLVLVKEKSNVPQSDRLKLMLSFFAGLRVSEIASLELQHVTDASGKLSAYIRITAENSKSKRPRLIPMHPKVAVAINEFRTAHPDEHQFALSRRWSKIKPQSTNALTVWFLQLYRWAGLEGCSSHSGRRTMITQLARKANEVGASLRDVQIIAGHARLETTERYIDPSANLTSLVQTMDFALEARTPAESSGGPA